MEAALTLHFPGMGSQLQIYWLPALLSIATLCGSVFYFLRLQKRRPFYLFSLADFSSKLTEDRLFSIEDRLSFLRLFILFILLMALPAPALLSPQDESQALNRREVPPKEGAALFILLDQSSSMADRIRAESWGSIRKIDYLKELTKEFVEDLDAQNTNPQRKDLIGLLGFARFANVIIPPTFEHDILNSAIDHVDVITSKEGDGTSISYAIYKTGHLIRFLQEKAKEDTHFNLDSSAMILITDGVEAISPEDVNDPYVSISLDAASAYAAKYHIPLYLIVIFPELNTDPYAPQKKALQKAASITNGGLYILNEPGQVKEALHQIKGLERKNYTTNDVSVAKTKKTPLWPTLLWVGFFLFLLYIYLEFNLFRSAP